ncbi:MAG: hypothetical protein WAZ19_02265 [Anaerolineae bacterium]
MKSVNDLTIEELEELRGNLYYQLLDDGSLDVVMGEEIDSEEQIPIDFVKEYYSDTSFVSEDFWCNIKSEA